MLSWVSVSVAPQLWQFAFRPAGYPRCDKTGNYMHSTEQFSLPASINRVARNHRKQVLRISCISFNLFTFQFVVIPHGERDLSSLPEAGEVAVQISSKKEAVGQLMRSHQGNSIFPGRLSKPAFCGFVRPCISLPMPQINSVVFAFPFSTWWYNPFSVE